MSVAVQAGPIVSRAKRPAGLLSRVDRRPRPTREGHGAREEMV
jgi:hypothetical protein